MNGKNHKTAERNLSDVVEDLTLNEIKTDDVKGGGRNESTVAESFGFGVEREMKE